MDPNSLIVTGVLCLFVPVFAGLISALIFQNKQTSVMRKIFPLKPLQSNESSAPKVNAEKKERLSNRRDEQVTVVEGPGRAKIKGFKENSLGRYLQRDHMSPFRSYPYGEDNDPSFKREKRTKINSKQDVADDIGLRKDTHTSMSTSPTIFTSGSCQENTKDNAGKLEGNCILQRSLDCSSFHGKTSNKSGTTQMKMRTMKRSTSLPKCRAERLTANQCSHLLPERGPACQEEYLLSLQSGGRVQSGCNSLSMAQLKPAILHKFVQRQSRLSRSQSENRGSKASVSSSVNSVSSNLSSDVNTLRAAGEMTRISTKDDPGDPTGNSTSSEKKEAIGCTCTVEEVSMGDESEDPPTALEFRNCQYYHEETSCHRSQQCFAPSDLGIFPEDQSNLIESVSSRLGNVFQTGKSMPLFREKKDDREKTRLWHVSKENSRDTNEDLENKAREAEEQAQLLLAEMELIKPYNDLHFKGISKKADIYMELLQEKIRRLLDEKRNGSLQLASELRDRVSERLSATEALKTVKDELGNQVHLIAKEKNALQRSLEKELDRRTKEWGIKLEQIKSEEQRLRDRVRELAEQNVSLQREIFHFHAKENEMGNHSIAPDHLVTDFKRRMKEAENEIARLKYSLANSQKQKKEAEEEIKSLKISYDAKERENHSFQKTITTLQRLCNDQDRTIRGLLESINDEIDNLPQGINGNFSKLEQERTRFIATEPTLQMESDSGRHEIPLPQKLTGVESIERGSIFLNFDQELWSQLDDLQTRSISVLDESNAFGDRLLELIKAFAKEKIGNQLIIHETMAQDLKMKSESVRKSVKTAKSFLKEKILFLSNNAVKQNYSELDSKFLERLPLEVRERICELKDKLTDEQMFSRVIKQKLSAKEAEVGHLQEQVAKMARNQQILGTENLEFQSLLENVSCEMTDFKVELSEKDQTMHNLEADLERHLKEEENLRNDLIKSVQERNLLCTEAERLNREIRRLNTELDDFRNKADKLEELVLIRDGEITILKETYGAVDMSE